VNDYRWCLGFIFSISLDYVTLLKKGRSLHIGLWNGVGGAVEDRENILDAMVRECHEETGIVTSRSTWTKTGVLLGSNWHVDVFATNKIKELPQIAYLYKDQIPPDKPVTVPLDFIHKMEMAPHTGALIHESIQVLKDFGYPKATITVG
jgi:8-oxo-dGTP pyrophosphatase MutT (NUDIX family)